MSQSTNPLSNLRITMNFPPTSSYNTIPSNTQSKVHRSATCRISLLEEKLHHDAKTASNLARISSASFSHHVGNVGIPAEKEEKRRGAVRNIGKISRSRFYNMEFGRKRGKKEEFLLRHILPSRPMPVFDTKPRIRRRVATLYRRRLETPLLEFVTSTRTCTGRGDKGGSPRNGRSLRSAHAMPKARSVLVYDCFVYA
ncbi:hypothetical protein U1Q18_051308, partial [Sarracenia purpurea var. burkii]